MFCPLINVFSGQTNQTTNDATSSGVPSLFAGTCAVIYLMPFSPRFLRVNAVSIDPNIPNCCFPCFCRKWLPKSEGIELKPQQLTIRAPDFIGQLFIFNDHLVDPIGFTGQVAVIVGFSAEAFTRASPYSA